MNILRTKMVGGAAIALVATGSLTTAAWADPSPTSPTSIVPPSAASSTLAKIQAKAASAISLRLTDLQAALTVVKANHYLTPADQSTIETTLSNDLAGLNALAPVIQADTTVAKARSDYDSVFTSYRVFALALPQARLAASADDLTGTVLPRLTDAQSRLEGLLNGADKSKDTTAVQAAMTDLANQLSAVTTSTSGVAATVLGYKPSDWNANHAILAQPRADLTSARSDAKQARADVKTVVEALK